MSQDSNKSGETQEPDNFSVSSQDSSVNDPYEWKKKGENLYTKDSALPLFLATLDEYIVKNNLPKTTPEELVELEGLISKLRNLIDKGLDLDAIQNIVDILSPKQMEELLKFQENEALSKNDFINVDNTSPGKLMILLKMGANFMKRSVDEQINKLLEIPGFILDTPFDPPNIDTVKDVLVGTKDTADKITKETKQKCDDYITTTTRKIKKTLNALYNTFYKIALMIPDEYQYDVWDKREDAVNNKFELVSPSEEETERAIIRFINETSPCDRKGTNSQPVYSTYGNLAKKAEVYTVTKGNARRRSKVFSTTPPHNKNDFLTRSNTVPRGFKYPGADSTKMEVDSVLGRTGSTGTVIDPDVDKLRSGGGKSKKRRKSGKRKTRRKQKKRKTRRKRRCKK